VAEHGDLDPDAERQREHLEELLALARSECPQRRVELYSRVALRIRVGRQSPGAPAIVERGRDEGLAVRSQDGAGRVRFAAASGIGVASLTVALADAAQSPGDVIDNPWWTEPREILRDHGPRRPLPGPSELGSWLDGAGESVCPAWVEHGRTLETLVADGGLRASRTRDRVWAVGLSRPDGEERPRMLAGRSLDELPASFGTRPALRELDPVELPDAVRKLPHVFEPPEAGMLVLALVGAMRAAGGHESIPVGHGFAVVEDPRHPLRLAGGSFDDAGFPTRYRVLADGQFATVTPRWAGDLRRDSFRDPPQPAFGTLVVADGQETLPDRGVRVDGLRIHRIERHRWMLEIDGVLVGNGRRLARSYAAVRPLEWVQRISGAVGKARSCPNGVLSPSLIVDGSF
jgi:hypothetical protein